MTAELVAYVDETESHRQRDPDMYALAAFLCPVDVQDQVRAVMRSLKPAGLPKLHWRQEPQRRRRLQLVRAVADIQAAHVVVVRDGQPGERSERRRRHCLERLSYELIARGVTQMVAESRGSADDRRDRDHLDALRARKVVTSKLRLDHIPGPAEPLLWVPDVVCGALSQSRVGEPQFWAALGPVVELVAITAPGH